ncbi:MAG TPA: DUF4386 domain-containing protein [Cyclobacteriaceae bacterium]|nr:DUF4386 domain-containing protein [Cyclobacteriaceae bacterium]
MKNLDGGISMRTAALVAGIPIMFFSAPYGEFYVFGNLIKYFDGAQTTKNLVDHPVLFLSGVMAMMITFIYDIVLAWACYIFLRPVNPLLSLLGAWLRIVYTGLAIVALFNFLYAFQVANLPGIDETYRQQQVLQLVNARRFAMELAYIVFGVYLILGGVLIWKASYIPKIFGVMVGLAGMSWIINSLKPYFFKDYNLSWMMIFGIGELAFGLWLLIKGTRIKESEVAELAE